MKRVLNIGVAALALLLASCSGSTVKDKKDTVLNTRTVYDESTNSDSLALQYTFVLPKAYDGKEKFPVVFLFDPHANGHLAVEQYAEAASRNGFILIGGSNIQNNMSFPVVDSYFKALLKEAKGRFNIDPKRQYVAGFSGGAKLAIMYARQMPQIRGAIACGGSVPFPADYVPDFYFAGIVGTYDFNYLETVQTLNAFAKNGFDFTSIMFKGGHQWPPVADFEKGLQGLRLYGMKTLTTPQDDAFVDQLYQDMLDRAAAYRESGEIVHEYEVMQQMNRWFNGVRPLTDIIKRLGQMESNPTFKKAVGQRRKLTYDEVELRSEYIRALQNKDFAWWQTEAERMLHPKTNSEAVREVSNRLRNYLSMASFMLIKTDLEAEKYDEALNKLKIYALVDPENPDVYLMYARYYLQSDDREQMLAYLHMATDKGFDDFEAYTKDNTWKTLMQQPEAIALWRK